MTNITCVYRAPQGNIETLIPQLDLALETNTIIEGYLNVKLLNGNHQDTRKVIELMSSYGLHQVSTELSRIPNTS